MRVSEGNGLFTIRHLFDIIIFRRQRNAFYTYTILKPNNSTYNSVSLIVRMNVTYRKVNPGSPLSAIFDKFMNFESFLIRTVNASS